MRGDRLNKRSERVLARRELDTHRDARFGPSEPPLSIDEREPGRFRERRRLDILPKESGEIEEDGSQHDILREEQTARTPVHDADDEKRILGESDLVGEIETKMGVEDWIVGFGLDCASISVGAVSEFDDDVRVTSGGRRR